MSKGATDTDAACNLVEPATAWPPECPRLVASEEDAAEHATKKARPGCNEVALRPRRFVCTSCTGVFEPAFIGGDLAAGSTMSPFCLHEAGQPSALPFTFLGSDVLGPGCSAPASSLTELDLVSVNPRSSQPTLRQLRKLLQSAESLPVSELDAEEKIELLVAGVKSWAKRCAKALSRQPLNEAKEAAEEGRLLRQQAAAKDAVEANGSEPQTEQEQAPALPTELQAGA